MTMIAKALTALLTGIGIWAATALADGQVTTVEWFGLTTPLVAALAVWAVPNQPPAPGDDGQSGLLLVVYVLAAICLFFGAIILWRAVTA